MDSATFTANMVIQLTTIDSTRLSSTKKKWVQSNGRKYNENGVQY